MGDLARQPAPSVNCRKRKADSDDDRQLQEQPQDSSPDPMLVDHPVVSRRLSNAPRRAPSNDWLPADTTNVAWPADNSPADTPPVSPLSDAEGPCAHDLPRTRKRPRIASEPASPTRSPKRHLARHPSYVRASSSTRLSTCHRAGKDVCDPAVAQPSVSSAGTLASSLLHVEASCSPTDGPHLPPPFPQIDLNSPHIPSLYPLINRQTLKELDLHAIMRNPQLRHDLLFDAGLQFRPTSGRRKRDLSDKYWAAVVQELENGCTCVSFDLQGLPHECACVCRRVPLPPTPVLTYSTTRRILTLRMPSRIGLLLSELREVLLTIIQPLTNFTVSYPTTNTYQTQSEQHAVQAAYLRTLFDPELIQQELKHQMFDPSGLFGTIGEILKSHCAPMRDRAVDAMVEVARSCAPGKGGSKEDAVKAVRMCLDILELMKLDIANHQLQTLRPFLIDTAGQYELKTFKSRKGLGSSLHITRQWMQSAHEQMLAIGTLAHPSYPSGYVEYKHLGRTMQACLCVLRGFVDLVFNPPSTSSIHSPPSNSFPSHNSSPSSPLPLYPETTYLDNSRLLNLAADASDTTALYMFLLLYRQLVFSDIGAQQGTTSPSSVSDAELLRLKKEIRDISSTHLGHCFTCGRSDDAASPTEKSQDKPSEADSAKWQKIKQDIVLQIAMRAKQAQRPRYAGSSTSSSWMDAPSVAVNPDERILKLAERWSDTHMQSDSSLGTMLRNRVRDTVFNHVVAMTFSGNSTTGQTNASDINTNIATPVGSSTLPATQLGFNNGMEPLADEIWAFSERLSRVASIHLGVYLPLYEQEEFIPS